MPATPPFTLGRREFLTAVAAACAVGSSSVLAQAPPQLPLLKLLVGFPGGAGVDPVARAIAEKLRGTMWTSVIVENRPGAGGRIAIEGLKTMAPDGGTLLLAPASNVTLFPHVFRKLSYDPLTDLLPVSQAFTYRMGLVVGPACPARTLQEYVAWVRANPAKNGTFATPALGSVPHLVADQFAKAAKIELTPVAYRGSAPIWNDLMGGQIPAYFTPIANDATTWHKSGKARILAMAEPVRSRFLPDVPTFKENGFPVVLNEWFGFFAPPKTPPELIQAQSEIVRHALANPEVVAALERYQMEPQGTTPQALAERIRVETPQWARVVQESGFKPEE